MLKRTIVIIATLLFSNHFAYAIYAKTPMVSAPSPTSLTSTTSQPSGKKSAIIPTPPTLNATGYVLMDAASGKIIVEKNADQRTPPASLTKIMTLYLISDALKNNRLQLTDPVTISERAWRMGGSKMFIKIGDNIPAESLIKGIIIASGNDACVAMSEHIAGSEETFVNLMNEQAKRLGMKSTHFTDCTGMPDTNHYTTPRDMAILARALVNDFPEDYKHWYAEKWFMFNGIKQPNRNRLLWQNPLVDGIKTGHTDDAGFCLVASGIKNNMRLISVIMGSPSDKIRTDASNALLNYGFRFYESHALYQANQPLASPRIWFGAQQKLPIGVNHNIVTTIPIGSYEQLTARTLLQSPIKAPIQKGQTVGTLTVLLDDKVVSEIPLVALNTIPKGNVFSRLSDYIRLSISGENKKATAPSSHS